jgi:hypothetical protein
MVQHGIVVPPGFEIELTQEDLQNHKKQRSNLKYLRGHFLEVIVDIEEGINRIIENKFLGPNNKFSTIFNEKILNSKSVSLNWKTQILKAIVEEEKIFSPEKFVEFKTALDELTAERNKWAHGVIYYLQENKELQAYLKYLNTKGEPAEVKLTSKYFENINSDLHQIYALINGLNPMKLEKIN